MALHKCPECGAYAFTWHIDEEQTPLTIWGCSQCHYGALEDESLERVCRMCREKGEAFLKDDTKAYWWCCRCERVSPVSAE